MLHATLHWPDHSFIDLWPLAMNYAVWVYNKLPQRGAGLSPEELFSCIKCLRYGLPCAHVFGCPVYVIDPRLQDGKKFRKWDSRTRQGIFVRFSPCHSTSIPLILNPHTQHISPQFHVIFDDAFTTVPSLTNESDQDRRFEQLFEIAWECYIDPTDITPASELLHDHWLSPSDLAACNLQCQQARAHSTPSLAFQPSHHPEGVPVNNLPLLDTPHPVHHDHMQPPPMAPEGVSLSLSPVPLTTTPTHPLQPPFSVHR
ncbi:hypothetical protein ACHAW6_002757 [Cyclotella cf. meneghiniana]